jgi:segregation and condensation protein B
MSDVEVLPELKEIVGAILFAARQPVSAEQILQVFGQTAGQTGGFTRDYAAVTAADLAAAIEAFGRDLQQARVGLRVSEVAQGYRLESLPSCGAWLRTFLDRGRPQRLTPPALETLAIVAYRQPVMRSEIEAVRGVAVDQILRNLLDMQLIRITGRSDLPGRPWLFGTSQKFLEHFGLKSLDDLPGTDELRRRDEQKARTAEQRQMELPQGGEPGGATGFRADMDADRPGEDEVVAQLSVADQEDPEELPDARPAPASGDETDAIRPQDYEDDERVSPPPRRKAAAAPAAPADDAPDAVADAPAGEAEAAVDGSAEEPVDEDDEDEFDDDDDEDDDDEDEDEAEDDEADGDGEVSGTPGKPG